MAYLIPFIFCLLTLCTSLTLAVKLDPLQFLFRFTFQFAYISTKVLVTITLRNFLSKLSWWLEKSTYGVKMWPLKLVFSLVVRILVKMPESHIGVPGFDIQVLLLMVTPGDPHVGSSLLSPLAVIAQVVGFLPPTCRPVLSSQLLDLAWPISNYCRHLGNEK